MQEGILNEEIGIDGSDMKAREREVVCEVTPNNPVLCGTCLGEGSWSMGFRRRSKSRCLLFESISFTRR